MRDWLKIVLGVGIGAAIALTIALPIVLTGDDLVIPDDPGNNHLINCHIKCVSNLESSVKK